MKPIDVIVAVPAHNERQLIRRCLDSLKIAAGHATHTVWPAASSSRLPLTGAPTAPPKRSRHATTHDHVYGANVVVRWDAYQKVGGFHAVEHGGTMN